ARRELRAGYPLRKRAAGLADGQTAQGGEAAREMRSPPIMPGSHNRPDVPPPITADGFYVTGDVFRRDDNGFHYFVGRTDDMFVSGGENIYPADVERMLERHPAVSHAAVVPVDDEINGPNPLAFDILKQGHAEGDVEI